MAIFNNVLGYIFTLKGPATAEYEALVRKAKSEHDKALSDGSLLKKDDERSARAADAVDMICEYVEVFKNADDEDQVRVDLKEMSHVPFAGELKASILSAYGEGDSEWIVDPKDEKAFETLWNRVVANAEAMRDYDDNDSVIGDRGQCPNVLWHGDKMEAALNNAWNPLYKAVRVQSKNPSFVRGQVKRNAGLLASGARDIELIFVASLIDALRTPIVEMEKKKAKSSYGAEAEAHRQDFRDTMSDAKARGRGHRGVIAGIGRIFGRAAVEAGMDRMANEPFHGPQV